MITLIFIATLILSLLAAARVKATYFKYNQIPARSGYTGAEAAHKILKSAGIYDVEVAEGETLLGDHYDPLNKRLVLCSDNYHGKSPAALGIAAHECGHAVQHQFAYAPLQLRMAAVGITNFASQIVTFLPILGMFTGMITPETGLMVMATAWAIIMGFNLITLPVEFDASRRAKALLPRLGLTISREEDEAVTKVLNAAAWTYVAAFITSMIYFLWHILPFITGRRQEE